MKLRCSNPKLGYWCCALAGIFSMNPYFIWPTFLGGILAYLAYLFYGLSICFLLSCCPQRREMSKKSFIAIILFAILYAYTYFHSDNLPGIKTMLGALLAYVNLFAISTRNFSVIKEVFERFVTLLIITLIPGLIYYVFELLGVSLSIGTLQSQNQLSYTSSAEYAGNLGHYKTYLGAVMRVDSNTRFSGIYDEPGLVGTVSSLLLAARKINIKKDYKSRWLLIFAIVSFSFAGYLLIITYYFLIWLHKGKWKLCLGTLVCIICFNTLINVEIDNPLLAGIQNRFQVSSTGISILNNRESSTFKIGYAEFQNASFATKMFGYGYGASSANRYLLGSSSYKLTIYDYGYFGLVLRLFIIVYLYKKRRIGDFLKNWDQVVLLILFIVSIYQRPAILYAYYFIVLYGGGAYLECLAVDKVTASWRENKRSRRKYYSRLSLPMYNTRQSR